MIIAPSELLNPAPAITLANDEAQVWQASVNIDDDEIQFLKTILSADELQRASNFIFEKDQKRFIIARARLRQLLSRYTGLAPAEIVFSHTENGKPYLSHNPFQIEFNISHSHELILLAFTNGTAVGIDIEHLRHDINAEDIAERFFTCNEISTLKQLPDSQKTPYFFQIWAKKEAIIKMLGTGLFQRTDEIEVEKTPDRFIYELFPADDYAAALCTEKLINNIRYFILAS